MKITNFNVPSSYIIEDDDKPLILDCEYTFQPNESGIILLWKLNDTRIYQWIVDEKPPTVIVSITKENTM